MAETNTYCKAVILQRWVGPIKKEREKKKSNDFLQQCDWLLYYAYSDFSLKPSLDVLVHSSVCVCVHYASYKYSVLFKNFKHANNSPSTLISWREKKNEKMYFHCLKYHKIKDKYKEWTNV